MVSDKASVTAIHDTMTQPNVLRRLKSSIVGALYVRFLRPLSLVQTFRLTSFPLLRPSTRSPSSISSSISWGQFSWSVAVLPLPPPNPPHIWIDQRTFYASHYGGARRGRHREQALLPPEPWLPETWRPRHVRIAPDTWPLGVQAATRITRRHHMRRSDWVKSSFFGARGRSEGTYLAHGR